MRDRLRRIPRVARAAALVAFLNALLWAIILPPFVIPDEVAHLSYAQYFAETGKLPTHEAGPGYSDEEQATIDLTQVFSTAGNSGDRPPWSTLQQKEFEDGTADKARDNGGHLTPASNNPPLYYGIEAVAYRLVPGTRTITRMYAMRVVSALMAAITVLFVFGFLRELLPGTPWAATAGAFAVALQPMFGFESGGINNDNLLYLCSAALFFALARAFRRGLDARGGMLIGAAIGAGMLSKYTMLAFVPVAALAVLWLVWRGWGDRRGDVIRGVGWAAALAIGPFLVYVLLNATVWGRPLLQNAAGVEAPSTSGGGKPVILRQELSYIWQLFLPRLPFMQDTFPNFQPIWDVWFTGFNGRFGLLDYAFPRSFYTWIFWVVYVPVLALAAAALVRWRKALWRHLPQLVVYLVAVFGLIVIVGRPSYTTFLSAAPFPFYQPRYILPLLPLFAAIVALAVRGAGRRAGPLVATAIVFLAATHTLLAQLMTLSRYYG
jgi:4-amino-4-deoxy-L-arabinose transferase-like glycosyltransferase